MGKILAEGKGEVQEMIDIADFAVGLSRQLYGLTMHSERPLHRMYEQWQPLGIAGVISAFNFPVAVWSWNALIAAVCGDTVVWKPSSETPLTAIAVQILCQRVLEKNGWPGVFALAVGKGSTVGERLLADRRVPLISATGSCEMGYRVAEVVGRRLGRTLLELLGVGPLDENAVGVRIGDEFQRPLLREPPRFIVVRIVLDAVLHPDPVWQRLARLFHVVFEACFEAWQVVYSPYLN